MWTLARQEKRKERKKKGGEAQRKGRERAGPRDGGRAERGERERSSKPTRCFMFLFCLGRLGLPDKVPDRVHPRRKHPAVTAFEKQVQSEEKKIISPRLKLTNCCAFVSFYCCCRLVTTRVNVLLLSVSKFRDETRPERLLWEKTHSCTHAHAHKTPSGTLDPRPTSCRRLDSDIG